MYKLQSAINVQGFSNAWDDRNLDFSHFELCWLPKVTSTLSKQSTERDGGADNNKVYVNIIDNLYVILTARRKLDEFKWWGILTLFNFWYRWTSIGWGEMIKEGPEANNLKRHW